MSWRAMALCVSSQGLIAVRAMQHTYSPKARAMRYVSVVIVPSHRLAKCIGVVLQDRLNLYDPAVEPGILGINSVENGMFLNKILHAWFAVGRSAFLKVREVDIHSEIF
jgi:hypothetical protein